MPQLGGFELGYGELGAPVVVPGATPSFRADGSAAAAFSGGLPVSGAFSADGAAAGSFSGDTTSAHARLTQLAVEALAGPGGAHARLTQLAVETLFALAAGFNADGAASAVWNGTVFVPPAAQIRETQAVLEPVEYPDNSLLLTQEALEEITYPPNILRITQAALEDVEYPPNDLWATQVALEVVLKGEFVVERHNHSFIGAWMATGRKKNASFAL